MGYFFSARFLYSSPSPDTLRLLFQYKKYEEDVKTVRERVFGIVNYINTVRANVAKSNRSTSDRIILLFTCRYEISAQEDLHPVFLMLVTGDY